MSLVPDRDERRKLLDRWVERQQECAKLKEERPRLVGVQLCAAMVDWLKGGSPPGIKLIAAAMASRRSLAHVTGFMAFVEVLRLHPESRPELLALFGDASIRSKELILSSASELDGTFAVLLAEAGSQDSSANVRSKAIEAMYWRSTDKVTKMIERMRPTETDVVVLATMERIEALARNGHWAKFNEESWDWVVWYRTGDSLSVANIPKIVVEAIGIEKAIAHTKAARSAKGKGFVAWDEIVDGA